jgi:hypothetical protein
MITIILTNCDTHLKVLGIDMNQTGATDQFVKLLQKKIVYEYWEYDFSSDTLKITVLEGNENTDLSEFGEVSEYVIVNG